jgi:hypothetical protein
MSAPSHQAGEIRVQKFPFSLPGRTIQHEVYEAFFSTISIRTQTQKVGAKVSCGKGSLGCHHFDLKAWPSVFLCTGRVCCGHGLRTFTSFGDVKRISGGNAVGEETLTACFIAHCARGVGGGSGWGESCDSTFLWIHFSRVW